MTRCDILNLFRSRLRHNKDKAGSGDEPFCCLQRNQVGNTPLHMQPYDPKSLSSYCFVIDFENVTDDTKSCSLCFESVTLVENRLVFEIPKCHDHLLPWADDYKDRETHHLWVEIDIVFTVWIIDRRTATRAKLYESKPGCDLYDYFYLSNFYGFEKCAALSLFSHGSNSNSIPVPSTSGVICCAWKEEYEHYDTRSLDVRFDFVNRTAGRPNIGGFIRNIRMEELGQNELLAFLDKGLVYK